MALRMPVMRVLSIVVDGGLEDCITAGFFDER